MSVLVAVLTLVLLAAVIGVVARPLFTSRPPEGTGPGVDPEGGALGGKGGLKGEAEAAVRSELEAAREAKYREIRDAELDYRTGKLSNEDYEAIDGTLRAEAVEILDRLEMLAEKERDSGAPK